MCEAPQVQAKPSPLVWVTAIIPPFATGEATLTDEFGNTITDEHGNPILVTP